MGAKPYRHKQLIQAKHDRIRQFHVIYTIPFSPALAESCLRFAHYAPYAYSHTRRSSQEAQPARSHCYLWQRYFLFVLVRVGAVHRLCWPVCLDCPAHCSGPCCTCFGKIYGEVVGALPLNGGAYNVLLNTTSKSNAAIAACLTILSNMAMAVPSAGEGINYLYLIAPIPHVPVLWATARAAGVFPAPYLGGHVGVGHRGGGHFYCSPGVAYAAGGGGAWFVWQHGLTTLHRNYAQPVAGGSIPAALFLGFSAAMLGISGFEARPTSWRSRPQAYS